MLSRTGCRGESRVSFGTGEAERTFDGKIEPRGALADPGCKGSAWSGSGQTRKNSG